MSAQKTLVTLQQLPDISARLSANGQRCELVEGELTEMAPAGGLHGRIANSIAFLLTRFVREGELGWVFAAETGFVLHRDPDTVRAPDVAFVSRERLGTDAVPSGFIELAPDFVVEVVSPSDSASGVQAKVEDWLQAGTRLVWVVYPETTSVAAYPSLQQVQVLSEGDTLGAAPVLKDFSVAASDLFK